MESGNKNIRLSNTILINFCCLCPRPRLEENHHKQMQNMRDLTGDVGDARNIFSIKCEKFYI